MKLVILDTAEAIAERAADSIEDLLAAKPAAVLGTATGSSPLPLYDELTRRARPGASPSRRSPASCSTSTSVCPRVTPSATPPSWRGICVPVWTCGPGALHGPDALSDDLQAACDAYEAAMAAAGYCDLQILGIGADGHIGFNEPGGPLRLLDPP